MARKLGRNYLLHSAVPFLTLLISIGAFSAAAQTGSPSQGAEPGTGTMDPSLPLFLPAVSYPSGGDSPRSATVADINHDGKPDVLVANWCANSNCGTVGTILVLLGNGDGTFQAVAQYSSTTTFTDSVAVADVNEDRDPDMVVANLCMLWQCQTHEGSVTIRTGRGDGYFSWWTSEYGSGGQFAQSVAAADVDGTGSPDLLVVNEYATDSLNATVGVLLNYGIDYGFQPAVTYGTGGSRGTAVAVADVNGDHKPDLVVANECASVTNCASGSVGVLLGNGDGTFQPATAYGSGGNDATSVAVADVNGDTKPDLVVANSSGSVGVLLGNGDGSFQPAATFGSGGSTTWSVAVADVNGDDKPDLIVANASGSVGVLLGNGDGTFQSAIPFASGGSLPNSVAVADVNDDGRPDVVVSNRCIDAKCLVGSVGVLMNNSGPHSPTTTTVASSVNPVAIGQPVVYTVTVTNESGEPLTGTVMFADNRTTTTIPLVGKQAVYTAVYRGGAHGPPGGRHRITATYSGDAANAPSTGTLQEYLGRAPTHTALASSGYLAYVGSPVTFTATVTWSYGTVPDGELVTFYDAKTALAAVPLQGGTATYTTSSLSVRLHPIKAIYGGDATFKPSRGYVPQAVVKYPTTTVLTASPNPSTYGQPVTFTATITNAGPSPTGKVLFRDGPASIRMITLSGGVATLTERWVGVGTHPITAQYLGDAATAKSISSVVEQVVQ
jgi:uncharacterized repeat protein (TIGR01451 family)